MHRRSQESGVISFPFARPVHFHLSVGSKGHKERVKKKKRKGGGGTEQFCVGRNEIELVLRGELKLLKGKR